MSGFNEAWAFVLAHEGSGCWQGAGEDAQTCWGIYLKANPDLKSEWPLSKYRATEVARTRYWDAVGAEVLPAALALMAFDAAFNQGVPLARRTLKKTQDVMEFAAVRLHAYSRLASWPTNGRGWARRVADCLTACAELERTERARRSLPLYSEKNQKLGSVTVIEDRKVYVPDGVLG